MERPTTGLSDLHVRTWNGSEPCAAGSAGRLIIRGLGTSGFAYGRVEDSTFGTALGKSISMRSDDNRTGYVVGGGIEYAFGGNLSLKVEYQFINLGDKSLFGVFTSSGVTATSSPIDASFHTVRAGLNLALY